MDQASSVKVRKIPKPARITGLLILAAGCISPSHTLVPSARRTDSALSQPRCYRVTIGPWSNTGQSRGLLPPTEFRLDTALSTWQFATAGARLVYPEFPNERGSRIPAEWKELGSDSVVIRWSTGFEMGGYRLQLHGDSVKGLATTWNDARTGNPDPDAPVVGSQVQCRLQI